MFYKLRNFSVTVIASYLLTSSLLRKKKHVPSGLNVCSDLFKLNATELQQSFTNFCFKDDKSNKLITVLILFTSFAITLFI